MATKKVIAIASGGGHWKQLMRLKDTFEQYDTVYVTTTQGLAEQESVSKHYTVRDCNRDTPLSLFITLIQLIRLLIKVRPDVVVTTGALPGLILLFLSRLAFVKTIWIDSIANTAQLSGCGKIAGYVANIRLTQWEHLADERKNIRYEGSLL